MIKIIKNLQKRHKKVVDYSYYSVNKYLNKKLKFYLFLIFILT